MCHDDTLIIDLILSYHCLTIFFTAPFKVSFWTIKWNYSWREMRFIAMFFRKLDAVYIVLSLKLHYCIYHSCPKT